MALSSRDRVSSAGLVESFRERRADARAAAEGTAAVVGFAKGSSGEVGYSSGYSLTDDAVFMLALWVWKSCGECCTKLDIAAGEREGALLEYVDV